MLGVLLPRELHAVGEDGERAALGAMFAGASRALLASVVSSFLVLVPIFFIHEPKATPVEKTDAPKQKRPSIWKILSRPLTLKLALPNQPPPRIAALSDESLPNLKM